LTLLLDPLLVVVISCLVGDMQNGNALVLCTSCVASLSSVLHAFWVFFPCSNLLSRILLFRAQIYIQGFDPTYALGVPSRSEHNFWQQSIVCNEIYILYSTSLYSIRYLDIISIDNKEQIKRFGNDACSCTRTKRVILLIKRWWDVGENQVSRLSCFKEYILEPSHLRRSLVSVALLVRLTKYTKNVNLGIIGTVVEHRTIRYVLTYTWRVLHYRVLNHRLYCQSSLRLPVRSWWAPHRPKNGPRIESYAYHGVGSATHQAWHHHDGRVAAQLRHGHVRSDAMDLGLGGNELFLLSELSLGSGTDRSTSLYLFCLKQ
jgi:hypothetical protein